MVIPSCPFPSFYTAKILLCISRRSHSCYISHPSRLPCFWRMVNRFCSLGWREKEMGVVNYSSQSKNIYGKLRNREIDWVPTYLLTLNATACPWLFWHRVTIVKWSDRVTVCVKSSTGFSFINNPKYTARGDAVCWSTALQAGRSWFRLPMMSLEFFIDMALWSCGRRSL